MSRAASHCANCGAQLPEDHVPIVVRGLAACKPSCARALDHERTNSVTRVDLPRVAHMGGR
jgi:hypothetical protein